MMVATIAGLISALLIIALVSMLKKYFSAALMVAGCLIAIAFIYVGFSLKDNRLSVIFPEAAVALVFYFMALYGFTKKTALGAIGIILHGVWDICHHNAWVVPTNIPAYWPPFCFTIDLIDGIYFYYLFTRN